MRQQLSLFTEPEKIISLGLEASGHDNEDEVRLDPEFEKTLPADLQYHPSTYKLLESSSSRLGDWTEGQVRDIALSLGAEVFGNVSCVGPADAVLSVEDQLFKIDVKIATRRIFGSRIIWTQSKGERLAPGVFGVCFIPAKSGMYCRWYNKKRGSSLTPVHPPGLRNFWPQPLHYP